MRGAACTARACPGRSCVAAVRARLCAAALQRWRCRDRVRSWYVFYRADAGARARRVLGQDNRNLARIVTVLGTVLARGSALVDPADAARMVTLLQQMQSSLPPQVAPPPSVCRCGCRAACSRSRRCLDCLDIVYATHVCAGGCLGRAACRLVILVAVCDLPSLACASELRIRHGRSNALIHWVTCSG